MDGEEHGAMTTVEYWDRNARWYDMWVRHNTYHERIIRILTGLARPGWRVLDIGGGGGVLALPLAQGGCSVTVIEPSQRMRALLRRAIGGEAAGGRVTVDPRRWEDVDCDEFRGLDLILACNSLHLTGIGLGDALGKTFLAQPGRVLAITEAVIPETGGNGASGAYSLSVSTSFETESSHVYHSFEDACEHWAFRTGRAPTREEKTGLQSRLIRRSGLLRLPDAAIVHIRLWVRKES